jgi:pilus biogenesis lipoprotein CpaD
MIHRKKKSLLGPLALLFMAGLVAACDNNRNLEPAGDTPEAAWHRFWNLGRWNQTPKPYKNNVELVTLEYKVAFPSGGADLDSVALGDLHGFLREQGVSASDQVAVDGPRMVTGGRNPLTTARIATLVAELNRTGLGAAVAPDTAGEAPEFEGDELSVRVSRYIVLSPECDAPNPELGERPEIYWSCSDARNLGAMVANPQDLIRGRDPGPATAEPNAASVNRYRLGQITPLVIEGTGN